MLYNQCTRFGILIGLVLVAGLTFGQTQQVAEDGFVSLVVGNSLAQWKVLKGNEGHWRAVDGMIDYDGLSEEQGRSDQNLYSKNWYRNFLLTFEWRFPGPAYEIWHRVYLPDGGLAKNPDGSLKQKKLLSAGDSGVYLRGTGKSQINLWNDEMGSGNVQGYLMDLSLPVEARRTYVPSERADKPLGEWNAMEITLVENTVTVVLNGVTVIDEAELPGLPYGGPIGFQHHSFGRSGGFMTFDAPWLPGWHGWACSLWCLRAY